jgi:hypothetical protein
MWKKTEQPVRKEDPVAKKRVTRKWVLNLTNEEILELYSAVAERRREIAKPGIGYPGTARRRYHDVLAMIDYEMTPAYVEANDRMTDKKRKVK